MADTELLIDNTDATYPSWPLIWIELTDNMSAIDEENRPDIFREDSPNFARHIYLRAAITLDPAPTAMAPVKVFIDPYNRIMFVDPASAHAQAGHIIQYLDADSRFWYLLPRKMNWITFKNFPDNFTVGVRWRRAYV